MDLSLNPAACLETTCSNLLGLGVAASITSAGSGVAGLIYCKWDLAGGLATPQALRMLVSLLPFRCMIYLWRRHVVLKEFTTVGKAKVIPIKDAELHVAG